jgi:4-hydroxy-4-methyl-2-oxoglutarate aldolase
MRLVRYGVNTNVHKALGCIGTITEGGVRDVVEMERLGFHTFSTSILVSHANVHYVDYGGPVRVGGITIQTGDLLHGDRHGVIVLPPEIPLHQMVEVSQEIETLEKEIFAYCQGSGFTPAGLVKVYQSVRDRWPHR